MLGIRGISKPRAGGGPERFLDKLGFHYGWIVVAVCACLVVAAGFILQSSGVVVSYLNDHIGWDPAEIALGISLFYLTSALCGPVVGVIADRYGATVVTAAGLAVIVLGVLVNGAATEIWQYWIGYGLFFGMAFSCIRLASTLAITEWFQRRIGLALGVLQAFFALGPAMLIPVFSILLENTGWRTSMWSMGLASCAALASLLLLLRSRPADLGLRPYGASRGLETAPKPRRGHIHSVRARAFWKYVRSSTIYWKLAAIHSLGSVGHVIVLVFILLVAEQAGIGNLSSAFMLSILIGVSAVGRLVVPIITDRLKSKWVLVVTLLMQALPVVYLPFADSLWEFIAIAVIFGIGFGGETPMMLVITSKYFGPGPMGRPFGCYEIAVGLVTSLGLWLAGLSCGIFGTHNYALAFAVGCSLIASVVALTLRPVQTTKYYEWENSLPEEARSYDFSHSGSEGVPKYGTA